MNEREHLISAIERVLRTADMRGLRIVYSYVTHFLR